MSTTDPTTDLSSSSSSRAPGSKLAGCYALTRRLELGTGTEVWHANDEVLGKDVSLHFAPEAVRKDNRALQELRLDIKKNRQLIHPNILRVYDLVEEPDWVAISMDVFEGESLAAQLERQGGKRGDLGAIQPWAEQVVRTLEEAHKINALHRDLSPLNIFLTPSGKALVANFGISRSIRDAQTRAGQAPASAFTSPQLAEGKAAARTDDVFSLGAVLYNAVVGQVPEAADGLSAGSRAALESTSVPAAWKATIAACLDKNPEARPQSAAEVGRRWSAAGAEAASAVAPAAAPAAPAPAPAAAPAAAVVAAAAAAAPAVAEAKPVEAAKPVEEPAKRVEETVKPAVEEPRRVEEPVKPAAEAPKVAETPKAAEEPVKRVEEPAKAPAEPIKRVEDLTRSAWAHKQAEESPKPAPEAASKSPEPARESKKETPKETSRTTTSPSSQKGPERPLAKDFSSRMYPEESRFPVTGLAAAAVVLVVVAVIYYIATSKKSETAGPGNGGPVPVATPVNVPETPAPITPTIATSTPKRTETTPAPVTPSPANPALAEKTTALDKAKEEAAATEKAYENLIKEQKTAEATLAETKKALAEKTKASESMTKDSAELYKQRKALEDDKKATASSSVEAQKFAEGKARRATEAATALDEFDKANAEKLAAPQQAEKEVSTLQKQIEEMQRTADDAAKAAAEAEAKKSQQLAAIAEREREIGEMKAATTATANVPPTVENRVPSTPSIPATTPKPASNKIDDEIAEMERIFREKKEELERKRREVENAGKQPPLPVATPPALVPAATPKVSVDSIPAPVVPPPSATPFRAMDVTKLDSTPAVLTTPAPGPGPEPTVNTGGGNSLGLKFVPVGDVDFCIWQTRVKDFEVFAKAVNLRSMAWKGPGFKQAPDHPVVNVSWNEAMAFCTWLTDKEHKDKVLPAGLVYRLPTDLEWSKAVGLPDETGKTPEMRDMGIPDVYPWGTAWPPPTGAGNYTGEETGSDVAIKGYDDGFPWTSPVGSFPPNKFGLYDMGGNVWQWCMDTWNTDSKAKVLRGASWYNGALKLSLLSSCRVHAAPDSSTDNYGFRIVRAKEDKSARK